MTRRPEDGMLLNLHLSVLASEQFYGSTSDHENLMYLSSFLKETDENWDICRFFSSYIGIRNPYWMYALYIHGVSSWFIQNLVHLFRRGCGGESRRVDE